MLRKQHPFLRQCIDVRRFYLLLSIASEVSVSQVVGKDIYDVGPAAALMRPG
jgi:hypothetical protein